MSARSCGSAGVRCGARLNVMKGPPLLHDRDRGRMRSAALVNDVLLFPGDVAAEEDEVRGDEWCDEVDRRDPEVSDNRRPVGRRAEEAVPGVELRAEQVGPEAFGARQHAEQ